MPFRPVTLKAKVGLSIPRARTALMVRKPLKEYDSTPTDVTLISFTFSTPPQEQRKAARRVNNIWDKCFFIPVITFTSYKYRKKYLLAEKSISLYIHHCQ